MPTRLAAVKISVSEFLRNAASGTSLFHSTQHHTNVTLALNTLLPLNFAFIQCVYQLACQAKSNRSFFSGPVCLALLPVEFLSSSCHFPIRR